MNDLNKELKGQAVFLGLCDTWQKFWEKDWSKEKMVEMMYRGLDFCLQHHWPSNEFILKHFDREFLRKSNIFVNDKYSKVNPKQSLILGTSEITLKYNAWNYGNIHVRDNSSINLTARNGSFVIAHLYENATIKAEQFDKGKIIIVKHSTKVRIISSQTIKIREEYIF